MVSLCVCFYFKMLLNIIGYINVTVLLYFHLNVGFLHLFIPVSLMGLVRFLGVNVLTPQLSASLNNPQFIIEQLMFDPRSKFLPIVDVFIKGRHQKGMGETRGGSEWVIGTLLG